MSLIRASNRFSPKTKVVDLFFLYNFYFGQISSFYMEIGVSTSQTRAKIFQTSEQSNCSALCTPAPIPATERRRATPRVVHPDDSRCPSTALSLADASKLPVPFLPSPSSEHSEQKRAELVAPVAGVGMGKTVKTLELSLLTRLNDFYSSLTH